ncbi:MAG: DUF4282 domain-containing protein [Pseudonocardia sp.]|nr:DUF4282 domain-containing protein [Pseudonocardia sp.]
MKARALLDPSFETRMTPRLLPWIYLALVGALGVAAGALLVGAFLLAWWVGLLSLVVVPIGVAAAFAVIRVLCEMIIDFARLPQVTSAMADGLVRMESAVDGVAADMPKIAFLSGSRKAPSPPDASPDRLQA